LGRRREPDFSLNKGPLPPFGDHARRCSVAALGVHRWSPLPRQHGAGAKMEAKSMESSSISGLFSPEPIIYVCLLRPWQER
jgi:hypothetical protein